MEQIKPYSCKPRAARCTETPLGDKFYTKAKLSFDPVTGDRIAEPGEQINLDAYIQASQASTDIVTIVSKFLAGDETVLNVRQDGISGDLSTLPCDINDMVSGQKLMAKAEAAFMSLPPEIRDLFDGDVNKYFNAVLEKTAEKTVNDFLASQQPAASEPAAAEGAAE